MTPKYTAPSQGRLVVSPSPGLVWREGGEGGGRGELAEARGRGERWEAMGIGEGGKGRGRREDLEDGELHTQTPPLEDVGAGNTSLSWLHVLIQLRTQRFPCGLLPSVTLRGPPP